MRRKVLTLLEGLQVALRHRHEATFGEPLDEIEPEAGRRRAVPEFGPGRGGLEQRLGAVRGIGPRAIGLDLCRRGIARQAQGRSPQRPRRAIRRIGLTDRDAYQLRDIREVALAPAWLMLLLSAALVLAAWRIEGR